MSDASRLGKILRSLIALTIGISPSFATSTTSASSQPGYVTYQVHGGESLSSILKDKLGLNPVYGDHGYIHQVVSLNRGKILQKGDVIVPGDILLIPVVNARTLKYGQFAPLINAKPNSKLAKAIKLIGERKIASDPGEAKKVEAPPQAPVPPVRPVSPEAKSIPDETPSTANGANPVASPAQIPPMPEVDESVLDPEPTPVVTPKPKRHSLEAMKAQKDPLESKPVFKRYSSIDFNVGATYLGLFGIETSNQTTGRLLSGLTPTFELAWSQYWSKDFVSRFLLKGQNITFEKDQNGPSISNPSFFNSSFGIGLKKRFGSRVKFNFDVETEQTLFYEGLASGNLQVSQVPLFRIHPQLEIVLIKRRPFELSILGGASYYSASNYEAYSIQAGRGFDGAIQVSKKFRKSKFDCKVGYVERDQKTTYLDLVEKDVSLSCGLSWKIGN